MTWTASFSQHTTATADAVWKRWTTAADWATDDPDTEWAAFDAPTVGTIGRVKSVGSPAQKLTFTSLVPNESMLFEIVLPLARLSFPHSMRSTALGLEVTHAVSFDGPLAQVYGRLIGRKIAQGLPEVVRLVTGNALA
jgi:hypothetical protein